MNCYKVAMVSSIEEFAGIKSHWNGLLDKSFSNSVFLTWEWLYNWWVTFKTDKDKLFIIIVKKENDIVGIAPLYLKKRQRFMRELLFLGTNNVCSDYLDFIIEKGKEKEILNCIYIFIRQHNYLWDTICLSEIPETSVTIIIFRSFWQGYKHDYNSKRTVCPYINLEGFTEQIVNSFAPNLKNTLKRKLKKFKKIDDSGFQIIESNNDYEPYFSKFLELNNTSLKLKRIISPFLDTKFESFHRNVFKDLYPKGMVRLGILKANGAIIGVIYLLIYRKTIYFYQMGFDPKWIDYSPGTLILYYCIQMACSQGYYVFDFLRGEENYKFLWTILTKKNMKLKIFNKNIKGFVGYYTQGISKLLKIMISKFRIIIALD